MLFLRVATALALVATTNALSCNDTPCDNADCIVLNNPPYYMCDCLMGYIPTIDTDVCVPGQAYDHGGDGDFDLCDTARCDPDSECNQDKGYVKCVCNGPDQSKKTVFQGVECNPVDGMGQGLDYNEDGIIDYPCSDDNNLCDPRAVCNPQARDKTLAECVCNQGMGSAELIILPGFSCPGGFDYDQDNDPCTPNHCDSKALCRTTYEGLAECHCPALPLTSTTMGAEGTIVRPFYACPKPSSAANTAAGAIENGSDGTGGGYDISTGGGGGGPPPGDVIPSPSQGTYPSAAPPPVVAELSCATFTRCSKGSSCVNNPDPNALKAISCKCNVGSMDLIDPHHGICDAECPPASSVNDPCGQGTTCTMMKGWPQCACPFGPVLHFENCD